MPKHDPLVGATLITAFANIKDLRYEFDYLFTLKLMQMASRIAVELHALCLDKEKRNHGQS